MQSIEIVTLVYYSYYLETEYVWKMSVAYQSKASNENGISVATGKRGKTDILRSTDTTEFPVSNHNAVAMHL